MGTARLRHHDDSVYALAFTPDGKTLISGGRDRTVRFWDVSSGQERKRLTAPGSDQVYSLALSADGNRLASGGDFHVCLWDVSTGKELNRLDVLPGPVRCLAFSPDGKTLAFGTWDKMVHFWRASEGKVIHKLARHPGKVTSLAFSLDGTILASGGEDRTACLWDVAGGKALRRFTGHREAVHQVLFTPDGKSLATAGLNDNIRFWDPDTGKQLRTFNTWGSLALTRDGKTMAVGADSIILFDLGGGKELRRTPRPDWPISVLAFSPDGKTLASGGWDAPVRLWDTATLDNRFPQPGHGSVVTSLAFLPDGRSLVSASDRYDLTCRVWDADTGREQRHFKVRGCNIAGLAVSPNGEHLALACTDNTVHLVKAISGEENQRFRGHAHIVTTVGFSPDGQQLVTGSLDKTVKIWNVASGKTLQDLKGHWGTVTCAVFSPDGKAVASTGASLEPVRLWDVTTGTELRQIGDPKKMYHSVAFTPDGKFLAASEWPGVTIWEVTSGKEYQRLTGPRAAIRFSPDGRTLWAKTADETLGLWEVATGALRLRLPGHGAPIHAMALAPDGRRLATGSADTTILLWDAAGRSGSHDTGPSWTRAQLETFWNDLGQENGERAHHAILALAGDPKQAAPFLRDHLHPVPAALVARLIADLDSPRFAARDKATRELQVLGKSADAALRAALTTAKTLEHRRRLEQLLERNNKQFLSLQQVRALRGIEALEVMATPEALRVLENLARAAAGTLEQVEAEASLRRLVRAQRQPGP
jgi:WD40 repeat protein